MPLPEDLTGEPTGELHPGRNEGPTHAHAASAFRYGPRRSWKELEDDLGFLSDIARFVLLVRARSYKAIEIDMGIKEPAARKCLKRLTKRVGRGPLFKEWEDGFTPTAEGTRLCQLGIAILEHLDEYRSAELESEVQKLRLCTIKSVWNVLKVGFLAAYQKHFKDRAGMAAPTMVEDPRAVYLAVERKEADFGLVSFPEPYDDLTVKTFWNEPMVFIAHPDNAVCANFRAPIRGNDLSECDTILTLESHLPTGRAVLEYLQKVLREFPNRRTRIQRVSSNLEDVADSVSQNLGVGIVAKSTVGSKHREGKPALRVFDLEPKLLRPAGIVYRKSSVRDPIVKFAIDWFLNPSNVPK